jgi:hypothetical protein
MNEIFLGFAVMRIYAHIVFLYAHNYVHNYAHIIFVPYKILILNVQLWVFGAFFRHFSLIPTLAPAYDQNFLELPLLDQHRLYQTSKTHRKFIIFLQIWFWLHHRCGYVTEIEPHKSRDITRPFLAPAMTGAWPAYAKKNFF